MRHFEGRIGYCSATPETVPPAPPPSPRPVAPSPRPPPKPAPNPAPTPPPTRPPPPIASPRPPPPAQTITVIVTTEAQITAALSSWRDGVALTLVVSASISITREINVPPGRVLTVEGDAAACAAAAAGSSDGGGAAGGGGGSSISSSDDAYFDYDYSFYFVPSLTALPKTCTLNAHQLTRFFNVTGAGSYLTLRNLMLLNGKADPSSGGGHGGAVRVAAFSRIRVSHCIFAGNSCGNSDGNGGALFIDYNGEIGGAVIEYSVFRDNTHVRAQAEPPHAAKCRMLLVSIVVPAVPTCPASQSAASGD